MIEYVTVWRNGEPTKLRWRVPIVRCKDCIWSRPDMSDHEYRLPLWCDRLDVDKNEDGFCDWGEAKGQSCS